MAYEPPVMPFYPVMPYQAGPYMAGYTAAPQYAPHGRQNDPSVARRATGWYADNRYRYFDNGIHYGGDFIQMPDDTQARARRWNERYWNNVEAGKPWKVF